MTTPKHGTLIFALKSTRGKNIVTIAAFAAHCKGLREPIPSNIMLESGNGSDARAISSWNTKITKVNMTINLILLIGCLGINGYRTLHKI